MMGEKSSWRKELDNIENNTDNFLDPPHWIPNPLKMDHQLYLKSLSSSFTNLLHHPLFLCLFLTLNSTVWSATLPEAHAEIIWSLFKSFIPVTYGPYQNIVDLKPGLKPASSCDEGTNDFNVDLWSWTFMERNAEKRTFPSTWTLLHKDVLQFISVKGMKLPAPWAETGSCWLCAWCIRLGDRLCQVIRHKPVSAQYETTFDVVSL